MKGKTYIMLKKTNQEGEEIKVEKLNKTMFDHREIFAFTLVEYIDREEPEYIHITTKMGVPLDLEYEEDLYIELANYFRKENLLKWKKS